MPNNVPVDFGSIGKTAPTATSGGGVETGPPEGKRSPSGPVNSESINGSLSTKSS
jgi:hypothetical protein